MDEYFEDPCIYIVRDPRDVVVSEYYFEQWETQNEEEFEDFFERFVAGTTKFESWKMHVGLWVLNGTQTDIKHIVRYEDIWRDPFTEFMGMCEFLQYPANEKEVLEAIDKCSFERCCSLAIKDNVDYRKRGNFGQPGKGRNLLTSEQENRIRKWTGDLMEKLGYE